MAGVSKLPSYLGGRRQKYWTETDISEVVQEAEPSWTLVKTRRPLVKTRRSRYKPVKLINSGIEQDVTAALAQVRHICCLLANSWAIVPHPARKCMVLSQHLHGSMQNYSCYYLFDLLSANNSVDFVLQTVSMNS